jgi:hypothetical protein
MLNRWAKCKVHSRIGALAVGLFLGFGLPGASAEDEIAQPSHAAPAPAVVQSPNPGPFESIGRWLDQRARHFRDQLRGAKARVDDLNERAAADREDMRERAGEVGRGAAEATIGAVEAIAKLPGARVMRGREQCAVAPNGAPDCLVAAEALCRRHGFASGTSIDFTSAEECPPRALIGDRSAEAECKTVTFVNRAMCQ